MNINKSGYLKNSSTKDNDYNIIPSNLITTNGMEFPIFANGKLLMPDTGDYKFNSNFVVETPALKKGGMPYKSKKQRAYMHSQHPDIAKRWDKENPENAKSNKLPMYKKKHKGMQAGGSVFQNPGLPGALGAAGFGASLLSPHQQYMGTDENAPTMGLGDAFAGAKVGMAFGPVGAAIGGAAGLVKDAFDYTKDIKDYQQNVKDTQSRNKVMYEKTHHPYGQYGFMQGDARKNVYSLWDGGYVGGGNITLTDKMLPEIKDWKKGMDYPVLLNLHQETPDTKGKAKFIIKSAEYHDESKEHEMMGGGYVKKYDMGGGVPDNRMKGYYNAMANAQTSHGDVSISKQDGGQVPAELNELFERAMQESGGDEEKAKALVDKHVNNPHMEHNKKPVMRKKKRA